MLASFAGFLIMAGTIIYALVSGSFWTEGPVLVDMPWGLVSLVDIYLGLLIFSAWVLWREQFSLIAGLWALLIIILGNMITCLYILKACWTADGDMVKFWHGSRVGKL